MKAIIINRKISTRETNLIHQLLSDQSHRVIQGVSYHHTVPFHPHVDSLELLAEEKKAINYDTLNKTLFFGEKRIQNQAISDLLQQDSFRSWYYFKFRTYFILRNTFYEVQQIKKALKQYESVIYYGENPYIRQYPFDKAVDLRLPQNKSRINPLTLLRYGTAFFIRSLTGFFQLKLNRNHHHMVIDHATRQPIVDINTLKIHRGNYNLSYLYEKMGDSFIRLTNIDFPKINQPYAKKLTIKDYFQFRNQFFGDWILLRGLWSKRIRNERRRFIQNFQQQISIIEQQCTTPEESIIIHQMKHYSRSAGLFYFKYLSYRTFFQHSNFKTVSTIDENSPTNRAILDAAKAEGIKTIGIQHGNIHDLHAAYLFTENDQSREVHSDYTLVWGRFWKDFLEQAGNYPVGSIRITGQIRTDIIPVLAKNKDKTRHYLRTIFNQKKIIMFASQPQRDPALRRRTAFDIFEAVKNREDVVLALKLHPNEKNDHDYYQQIATEAGCRNYTIINDIDLYILLSFSDIVITSFSTVGTEAVYFRKPLIIWDPLHQDLQHYHREGIAFSVSNAYEIRQCIADILDREKVLPAENIDRFISKYAHKIDGRATERTLQFITKLG